MLEMTTVEHFLGDDLHKALTVFFYLLLMKVGGGVLAFRPQGTAAHSSSSMLYRISTAPPVLIHRLKHLHAPTHTHPHTIHWAGAHPPPILYSRVNYSVAGVWVTVWKTWTLSCFADSVVRFLLTWSWEMLKLDLTGQSSHVSFSRNILSSSTRALTRGNK